MDDLNKNSLDLEFISYETGGFLSANKNIFNNIELSNNSKFILNQAIKGTPMLKIGNGSPKIMIVAGVHGNELAPQIAALRLIDDIFNLDLNGAVYIIPFASPKSTMDNSRYFDGIDLNRTSHKPHTITNLILNKARELNVSAIGDFHSSAPNSNPGKEGVFCTQKPSLDSFLIADYISKKVGSEKIVYPMAGITFKGALEDEANLKHIPAVTCEVLSAIGYSNDKICKRSYLQMRAFLEFFGIIRD